MTSGVLHHPVRILALMQVLAARRCSSVHCTVPGFLHGLRRFHHPSFALLQAHQDHPSRRPRMWFLSGLLIATTCCLHRLWHAGCSLCLKPVHPTCDEIENPQPQECRLLSTTIRLYFSKHCAATGYRKGLRMPAQLLSSLQT